MKTILERERRLESIRKDAAWLGFWSRFGQIMAGYVVFFVGLWLFGDWSSSSIWNVVTVTLAWAIVGAVVSLDGSSREARIAVNNAEEHERRIRAEIEREKGAAKLPT